MTKFKVGDKVIWARFINDGVLIPLNQVDIKYRKIIKSKKVLTISEVVDIDEGLYYHINSPIILTFQDFYEEEFEFAKITNWRKRIK